MFVSHEDITDSIIYKEDDYLEYLDASFVDDYRVDYLKLLNRDRYYGKLIDYTPSEDNTANIDLKRVVAGLTFNVKGLTSQSALKIEIEESPTIEIYGDEIADMMIYNSLISLSGERIGKGYYFTDKWFENPIDKVPFKFTWTNGERTESFTQTVTLKRKMNYTFQITIPETFLVNNGITVTEEDKTWDDDITVDNIYFGDLTIENEEDLRAFKEANYTKVTGDLIFRYWDNNIMGYERSSLESVGGDLKFIANDKCLFNDMEMFPYTNGTEINGSIEVIATVPRCFCNLRYFKGVIDKIGGNFKIVGTEWSFTSLECIYFYLDEIGGNIEITTSDNNSFNVFRGTEFCSLKKIGGDIILKNLPALKDYCDLKSVLQNHTGQFIVSGNAYNPTKEQILAGECSIQ